jgi:hypothetical protein
MYRATRVEPLLVRERDSRVRERTCLENRYVCWGLCTYCDHLAYGTWPPSAPLTRRSMFYRPPSSRHLSRFCHSAILACVPRATLLLHFTYNIFEILLLFSKCLPTMPRLNWQHQKKKSTLIFSGTISLGSTIMFFLTS